MSNISIHTLFIILVLLLLLSAFFSGSETGMMAINRYRLRHLIRKKNRRAVLVSHLLQRPDRLLGIILIGNTFANIFASAVATIIAVRLFGDIGVVVAGVILAMVVLIFSEITPKTLAAMNPQRFAFFTAWPLYILLKILYPLVWLGNKVANSFLRLFRVEVKRHEIEQFTSDELRTIVAEATKKISTGHRDMLTSILDLDRATVDDIMIPRQGIMGIDLHDPWSSIVDQLSKSPHRRLPVCEDNINHVKGFLHVRNALYKLSHDKLDKKSLITLMEPIYFIPEGTPLHVQLKNFQDEKSRIGMVVDEYGEVIGLLTMEDILEEIVGEFTADYQPSEKEIREQEDGSVLVNGSLSIRDLNRSLQLDFPVTGPKTLNGLIVEQLELIPKAGIGLYIAHYPVEILECEGNKVTLARIWPKRKKHEDARPDTR